ncbi:hypothetical protein CAPTEDRAFT_192768 [Capitella teleta]|uniref:Uncharacterized protein n=1 Tax=Capitella teleta TaxID=283909 RepID=R7VAR7_CAPTE|nr:hypothetical protein CAPTEDRAFT_192768 [Capitella teleta]|eukprot:ELU13436.1 hypothetical protein CAPTEDRAFT_192768 [Capitella teleta]
MSQNAVNSPKAFAFHQHLGCRRKTESRRRTVSTSWLEKKTSLGLKESQTCGIHSSEDYQCRHAIRTMRLQRVKTSKETKSCILQKSDNNTKAKLACSKDDHRPPMHCVTLKPIIRQTTCYQSRVNRREVTGFGTVSCKLFQKSAQRECQPESTQEVITIPTGSATDSSHLPQIRLTHPHAHERTPLQEPAWPEEQISWRFIGRQAREKNASKYFMITWLNAGCEATKFAENLGGEMGDESRLRNSWSNKPLKA